MKKILSVLLTAVILSAHVVTALAAESTARTITIFKVEGDVEMTKGTAKKFTAKDGMRLADGYTVATGVKSYAWLLLDEETLIKMDQRSKVSVSKASASKLSVTVLSGAVSVDAATQKDGNSLEVRAGNSALAVRGTSFVIDCQVDGATKFIMISGSGTVGDTTLEAGMMLTVTVTDSETGETTVYDLTEITVDSELSPFVIDALLEHRDELLESDILTDEILEIIEQIKEESEINQQQKENTVTNTDTGTNSQIPISQGSSQSQDSAPPPPPADCISVTFTTSNPPMVETKHFSDFATAMAYFSPLADGSVKIEVYGDCRLDGNHVLFIPVDQVEFIIKARLLITGTLALDTNTTLIIEDTGVLAGEPDAAIDFTAYENTNVHLTNNSTNVYFLQGGLVLDGVSALYAKAIYTYTTHNGCDAWACPEP